MYSAHIKDKDNQQVNPITSLSSVRLDSDPDVGLDQYLYQLVGLLDPALRRMTQQEYDELAATNQLRNRYYGIYDGNRLKRLYLGYELIHRFAAAPGDYYKAMPMERAAFEALNPDDCEEGVLYLGLEEDFNGGGEVTPSTWHFGDKFPIRFS